MPCCAQQYMALDCSLNRIDSVPHLCLRTKAASHMFLGTARDDWCPYCTSTVLKIPDTQGFSFYFFLLCWTPCSDWGEEKGGIWGIGSSPDAGGSSYSTHASRRRYLPPQPAGTCEGREQLVPRSLYSTWWVRCYRLGRIRPPRRAIITTRDLNLSRGNEIKGKVSARVCVCVWEGVSWMKKFSHTSSLKSHPLRQWSHLLS